MLLALHQNKGGVYSDDLDIILFCHINLHLFGIVCAQPSCWILLKQKENFNNNE